MIKKDIQKIISLIYIKIYIHNHYTFITR